MESSTRHSKRNRINDRVDLFQAFIQPISFPFEPHPAGQAKCDKNRLSRWRCQHVIGASDDGTAKNERI